MNGSAATKVMLPLALLAGGLATRLRPITEKIPKSMVEVAGEPFIAHQLRLLVREGVTDVVICSGYLDEQIEAFVGNGDSFGCRVRYSPDGIEPLGTGGALRRALPLLGERFTVTYGDSYLDTRFRPVYEAFCRSGLPAQRRAVGHQ
jgi:NDP-sugar pyrophosphorylase family protein